LGETDRLRFGLGVAHAELGRDFGAYECASGFGT
jgi:hypothetical protein